jgi:hypothetical protein
MGSSKRNISKGRGFHSRNFRDILVFALEMPISAYLMALSDIKLKVFLWETLSLQG